MIIRVLPDSKAVDALCICYERKRIYRHEGKEYYVVSLDVKGSGRETRLVAELEPVWSTEVMF
ncbi:hypothetical protein NQO50_003324 [Vibrio vulnificus]|uniref:hypothetical protein n=1 Tax=Vibrio vulnificus TaxID=672 RepID=UPI000D3E9395|nr:hypothetical protein [Vibrio vulnificus]EJN6716973.1 hypothetical protein [Vibrio vulnificus]MBN8108628.1 hypothetical protein [Vibrio vulnificus]MBN8146078.1 hypothetical protein [Vibrio vulnificus]PUZ89462.1 hypothetical protein DC360_04515 [Vibrio vulnificus]HAS6161640.1 hypothetical protein [Vibrio vulnificus]